MYMFVLNNEKMCMCWMVGTFSSTLYFVSRQLYICIPYPVDWQREQPHNDTWSNPQKTKVIIERLVYQDQITLTLKDQGLFFPPILLII